MKKESLSRPAAYCVYVNNEENTASDSKFDHQYHPSSQHVKYFTLMTIFLFVLFFVVVSHGRWDAERARLPSPPTAATLSSCTIWSLRIFPSLPCSCLTNVYRDPVSSRLQLVNLWLSFACSRSHDFRYVRKPELKSCFAKSRTHDFRTTWW